VLISLTTITHENRSPLNDLLGEYADVTRQLTGTFNGIYVPAREAQLAAHAALPRLNERATAVIHRRRTCTDRVRMAARRGDLVIGRSRM